jgi:lipoate-protein ligase A
MGSGQPASDFDADRLDAAGLELVRRRSGGGAVLVAPGRQVWLDVFVPAGDVLAHEDVGMSFHWLGEVFAGAIGAVLGASQDRAGVEVHRAAARTGPWSKVLCYSGLGAGEVTVAGRKVVGMSQRRGRFGSWIHSMALLGGQDELAGLLAGTEDRRRDARAALGDAGLRGAQHLAGPLTAEILSRLP